MVLVQKWPFFQLLFFKAIQARKMSFTIFWNEKMPFQAIKTRSAKSGKINIFLKGLTHRFGPKMAIFPTFFFQPIQATKMSFTIFQNEKMPFHAMKTRSSKSRKIYFFPKVFGIFPFFPWFWSKNARFSNFFFRQYKKGNVFYDILERKNAFLGYKNKKFKKSKNCHFSNRG